MFSSSIKMDKMRGVFKYRTFENGKNSGKLSDHNGAVHRFKSFMSEYVYPNGKETSKGKYNCVNDNMCDLNFEEKIFCTH